MERRDRYLMLAEALKRLQKSSPVEKLQLDGWYESSRKFTAWKDAEFPHIPLPSLVMFYLHDADIRVKDEDYRKDQEAALSDLIAMMEKGVMPAYSRKGITFHPRWLGVAGLVALAFALYWIFVVAG
ncbi:hypothetical protein [Pseudoxanthomonas sp.]|uniref:hypothetical protein n=1 Tax=Pseudoxanthomonas sp. TaxID=1871049 RepID=UPI003F7E2024